VYIPRDVCTEVNNNGFRQTYYIGSMGFSQNCFLKSTIVKEVSSDLSEIWTTNGDYLGATTQHFGEVIFKETAEIKF